MNLTKTMKLTASRIAEFKIDGKYSSNNDNVKIFYDCIKPYRVLFGDRNVTCSLCGRRLRRKDVVVRYIMGKFSHFHCCLAMILIALAEAEEYEE